MNKKDKKLQKHLVDEMMKVYETNPNVMIYMQSLMENYEKLEQENKQLKEKLENDIDKYEDAISYQLGYDNAKAFYEKILTELEEWLKEQGDNGIDEWGNHYTICLYKLNKLKEKYK